MNIQLTVIMTRAALCCGLFVMTAPTTNASSTEDNTESLVGLMSMSLKDLMLVKVTSVSLFERDTLTVGSTVSVIEPSDWQREGARTMLDAIALQPSTMLLPSFIWS